MGGFKSPSLPTNASLLVGVRTADLSSSLPKFIKSTLICCGCRRTSSTYLLGVLLNQEQQKPQQQVIKRRHHRAKSAGSRYVMLVILMLFEKNVRSSVPNIYNADDGRQVF